MTEVVNTPCAEMRAMAERELASFRKAVTKMFGAEQARVSVEEWIDEVRRLKVIPATAREWRDITVRTAARLAARMNEQLAPAC